MKSVANVLYVLALLVTAALLLLRLTAAMHGMELWVAVCALALALWLFMLPALLITVARKGFEWLRPGRVSQLSRYVLVIAAATCVSVVAAMSAALWNEPADQVPWVIKPFLPLSWPSFVLPFILSAGGMLALNPAWSASLKPRTWRVPLVGASSLAILVVAGLSAELLISMNEDADRRASGLVADAALRDELSKNEAEHGDPRADLRTLLTMTNVFNTPAVREAALKKLAEHPDLINAIVTHIRQGGCEDVLVYLEGTAPPDAQALAEPVREAFSCMARRMREDLAGNDMQYDVNFDAHARRILAVADRFQPVRRGLCAAGA